jgi:hypothetical protein
VRYLVPAIRDLVEARKGRPRPRQRSPAHLTGEAYPRRRR